MKNVKYIIKEAKKNTNSTDKEAIEDEICINLLNRSLRYLIATLYNLNVRTKLFRKEQEYNPYSWVNPILDLPEDIYAKNAIISLRVEKDDDCPIFIPQIADKNRGTKNGYVVLGDKIRVTGTGNAFQKYVLTYAAKVPLFGLPFSKVTAISGNTITMEDDDSLNELCEMFSVVDKNGNILAKNISYEQSLFDLTTTGDISSVVVGNFIVPGEYSTTHCPLPEELDVALTTMLEAFIMARQSSTDLAVSQAISNDYLSALSELFTDNSVDEFVPPIMEYSEWV